MAVLTQIRVCRIGACSTPIPVALNRHGVCLAHHLDEVFTRVSAVQALCRQGQAPDTRTVNWLGQQGDLAVTLLSGDAAAFSEDRARLLDLLLCLANLHECLRQRTNNTALSKAQLP